MLIDALKKIQKQHGYLPGNELKALSERAKIPMYEIHGVASFYPHFRLEPPPEVSMRVCTDMSCHLNGAGDILDTLTETVGYAGLEGWEVQPVSCLGQCDGAPAVAINDQSFTHMTEDRLANYVIKLAEGSAIRKQALKQKTEKKQLDPYDGPLAAEALKHFLQTPDADRVIETLKESGMRGMGGAGFPTGFKWELVRQASGDVKYVVCNADESEPGTFKDRDLLQIAPHLVIEGMILGALVIGADQGYIFLRHEYNREREILERMIRRFYKAGFLGKNISGSDYTFDLEIFDSPGGYICGEETAMLEAMEGKRAEPRNKPPFPGTHGLHGKPTLINNVETFAWIPAIINHGGSWFKNQGINGAAGLKYIALSGHVNKPGVYEIPLGTTVRDLIQKCGGGISGGQALKAFAPGGASSGFLPASMADIPLDFKPLAEAGSMLGSGAVVAVAEGTDMVDLARNVITFFRNESCGKCVPCRTGTENLVHMLDQVLDGQAHSKTMDPVSDVSEAMALTSICGLGQAAPVPVTSMLKYFPDEIERYLLNEG